MSSFNTCKKSQSFPWAGDNLNGAKRHVKAVIPKLYDIY